MRVAGLFKRLHRMERQRVVGVELVEEGGQEEVVGTWPARAAADA
jgi:hypothetical protein